MKFIQNEKTNRIRKEIANLVEEYAAIATHSEKFCPGISVVPPSGKILDGDDLRLLIDSALDGWLTAGRFNASFEKELSRFLGVKHVLTVNSGSSANLIAFSTLTSFRLGSRAIHPGDEVITVAAGFPTTVNPIIQCGAIPVFVDVELSTYNIDPEKIRSAITEKTKAVVLAHTLGNPFDLGVVREICSEYSLWLIEDCCDALGTKYKGKPVGTFGDLATLSFYPAHHITTGEGGAVFTNNSVLRSIAESFRDWGRDCYCPAGKDDTCGKRFGYKMGELPEGYDHKYIYSHVGYNMKLTDMQAACGLGQLKKLDFFIERRKENFTYLQNRLAHLSKFLRLPMPARDAEPSWFGFPITLIDHTCGTSLDLLKFLDKHKIGTRKLFAGNLARQPYMRGIDYRVSGTLVNTDKLMEDTFWVGIQPAITKEMLDYTAETLSSFFDME